MIVRSYGDAAVLVEPGDPTAVLALCDAASVLDGVLEVIPAARTLLVRFDPGVATGTTLRAALEGALTADHPGRPEVQGTVELAVHYDGADLDAVADEVGCTVAALIERHAAAEYTVAFCGFSPGFAYLTGLEPALHVPRLASPRTSVPAGSVAIAGGFTGIYPRSSPGGWRLLGRTDAALWDLGRTPPALLVPGTRVRFVSR
ncbi:MAG TPA: allophanate hydrolase subunit 1 [Jatrophihabitantaceae bacterium]|nr:allophanate hydrolase subunit 1 [Jatrophihabitantaceae bacterium]